MRVIGAGAPAVVMGFSWCMRIRVFSGILASDPSKMSQNSKRIYVPKIVEINVVIGIFQYEKSPHLRI